MEEENDLKIQEGYGIYIFSLIMQHYIYNLA